MPVGGAGQLTKALVNRARAAGARIECGREVDAIEVSGGRAVAVRTADGSTVRVRRAVIADTSAPSLYGHLLPVASSRVVYESGPDRSSRRVVTL